MEIISGDMRFLLPFASPARGLAGFSSDAKVLEAVEPGISLGMACRKAQRHRQRVCNVSAARANCMRDSQ
jgi:hypothetical protein